MSYDTRDTTFDRNDAAAVPFEQDHEIPIMQ
jgi:hypothetical protein